MNAVEIEQAVSNLAEAPFDPAEFPYAFLEAFGNKETTLKRLRTGSTNQSDLEGGVLQRNNIHLKVCDAGQVSDTLKALRESPATSRHKVKYILATDGITLESERLIDGETLACEYNRLPDRFTFFLPLAGISTVRQIDESAFDIRATSRLNRLYVELLKTNPDWDTDERREAMNRFFARLIFCFFAEDTNIFNAPRLFTATVEQFSDRDSTNTHEVISEIFRAMRVKSNEQDREAARIPNWANQFPYVNGGLFGRPEGENPAASDVPRFSKIARSYLLHVGNLDWTQINPDIFGSMIQAVADDEERGALGMHYTSVPNILKVLNPLFLDDLREKLEEAGDNSRKLLNLRNRMARIRVFDPACGSGNFLVIAYKQMREIEAEINRRRGEADRRSEIPLTNFRGIEIRHFSCEIARLALIIAEYQCDVLYRGEKLALAEFLPLEADNWITCGNALRLDWLTTCPPKGAGVKRRGDDLFNTPLEQPEIDFENTGGEVYICGNPPYTGTRKQDETQKQDLEQLFAPLTKQWKNVDYVAGWFLKAGHYCLCHEARFAFVATNSLCQGQQIPITWKLLLGMGLAIRFAYTSFKWKNLASNNAGVSVVIVGLDSKQSGSRFIFGEDAKISVDHINPYLTHHRVDIIHASRYPQFCEVPLEYGVYYSKSAGLLVTPSEVSEMLSSGVPSKFFRQFLGSQEFINGKVRYALWISDNDLGEALKYGEIAVRIDSVRRDRSETRDSAVNRLAERPHQFREFKGTEAFKIFVPLVSSEDREYFPAGIAGENVVPTNKACYGPFAPLWALAILVSRIHLVWIGTVCGRLEMRYSYSNTLGWNTFPVPTLTEQNKADLTRCAEEILLAREAHFPATIADLYDPEKMPQDLRDAHDRNDEVLERIYIGRRFKNDTERLEKLFEMYTRMTANKSGGVQPRRKRSSSS